MDRAGVDAVLLCPWVSLTRYDAPATEALSTCRTINDALAAIVAKHPKRVAALGQVPLQDVALAISELERLMQLGLKGVEIGTNVNGVYPGDARFRPFWGACESLNAFTFIHPIEGGGRPELRDYYMWNVIGNPIETGIAAGHLILSGVIERHPELKIMLAHGGGVLPYLRGRLDRGFTMRPEINQHIAQPPSEYLNRFFFDTITHDVSLLRQLIEFAGSDHVLLGSDYPFDMGDEHPAQIVRSANLGADVEAKILGGNAAQLFGLV